MKNLLRAVEIDNVTERCFWRRELKGPASAGRLASVKEAR